MSRAPTPLLIYMASVYNVLGKSAVGASYATPYLCFVHDCEVITDGGTRVHLSHWEPIVNDE